MQAYLPNNNNIQNFNKILYSKCNPSFINQTLIPKLFKSNDLFEDSEFRPIIDKFENDCHENQKSHISQNELDFNELTKISKKSIIYNYINDLEIRCLNFESNCTWKGKLFELLSHLSKDCPGVSRNSKMKQKIKKIFKPKKAFKCLFSDNGCKKIIHKQEYPLHLIKDHYEEIFCSVKKFDVLNEEKIKIEKKYKRLLRGVVWKDFYQKKMMENLSKENKILRKKLLEIEEESKRQEDDKQLFKPFLSDNSETRASLQGRRVMIEEKEEKKMGLSFLEEELI